MLNLADIKATASAVGFDICGVTKCKNFALDKAFLESWIESGFASDLDYLKRNTDKRADATLLVEGAKSVIVCGVNYKNLYSLGYAAKATNKIASYALTTDYHTTIKSMLKQMCDELKRLCPTLSGRCFTDSAPVFEKRYAVEAGLGWIGRQSLLITPQYGSFVLLGVAIISEQCDSYDAPYTGVGCGNCRRCIDACPNCAIIECHIDTRRCISKATIERDDLAGSPVYYDFDVKEKIEVPQVEETNKLLKLLKKGEVKKEGICYIVPGRAKLKIYSPGKIFFEDELPFAQFGTVEVLSKKLFGKNSNTKVLFDTATGGIISIDNK